MSLLVAGMNATVPARRVQPAGQPAGPALSARKPSNLGAKMLGSGAALYAGAAGVGYLAGRAIGGEKGAVIGAAGVPIGLLSYGVSFWAAFGKFFGESRASDAEVRAYQIKVAAILAAGLSAAAVAGYYGGKAVGGKTGGTVGAAAGPLLGLMAVVALGRARMQAKAQSKG